MPLCNDIADGRTTTHPTTWKTMSIELVVLDEQATRVPVSRSLLQTRRSWRSISSEHWKPVVPLSPTSSKTCLTVSPFIVIHTVVC
jgi:hypothetical protein